MKPIILLGLVLATVSVCLSKDVRGGSKKKMVCYYGTWSVYRPGNGRFDVEHIDPHLCTHVVYGFAKLADNQIQSYDPWQDLKENYGKGGFLRFTSLREKNPDLKLLIAIGGWNEGSPKYSEMASSPMTRKIFIDSVVPFLQRYNFDGLDLDWEYPTARGGKPEDKDAFTLLVSELRKALNPGGYLLTAAVSPNVETVANAYNVPSIARDLDFINVMCYDYHGAWEGHTFTGHNTPLYRNPLDEKYEPFFNVNDTVNYWLDAGLPKEKLILGMALYGRGFTLERASDNGLYAPAPSGIPEGPYTRQAGIWGYNEICEVFMRESEEWKIVIDPYIQAPYAYNERKWIGYEDVESLYYKARFAREMDVGGAMVWSIETDDFRGICHGEKYILINTIKKTMAGGGKPSIPPRPQIVEPNAVSEIEGPEHQKPVSEQRPQKPKVTSTLRPVVTETEAPAATGECTQEGINPGSDCSGYIVCVPEGDGWRTYYQKCPSGLAYDHKIKGCNYATAVPGCGSKVGLVAVQYKTESN